MRRRVSLLGGSLAEEARRCLDGGISTDLVLAAVDQRTGNHVSSAK